MNSTFRCPAGVYLPRSDSYSTVGYPWRLTSLPVPLNSIEIPHVASRINIFLYSGSLFEGLLIPALKRDGSNTSSELANEVWGSRS